MDEEYRLRSLCEKAIADDDNSMDSILRFDHALVHNVLIELLDQKCRRSGERTFDMVYSEKVLQLCGKLVLAGNSLEYARSRLSVSSCKCEVVWLNAHVAYRCRDCGTNESSCMCVNCFDSNDHEGHDYRIYHSHSGGCCDCGDANAWKRDSFCKTHSVLPETNVDDIVDSFKPSAKLVFRALAVEALLCLYEMLGLGCFSNGSSVVQMINSIERFRPSLVLQVTRDMYIYQKESFLLKILDFFIEYGDICSTFRQLIGAAISYGHVNALDVLMKYGIYFDDAMQEKLGVLFLKSLSDDEFKISKFAPTFSNNYGFLIDMYLGGTPSSRAKAANFIDRILCQLCSSTLQISALVDGTKGDMLGVILIRLLDILQKHSISRKFEIMDGTKIRPIGPDGGFPPCRSTDQLFNSEVNCDSPIVRNPHLLERLVLDLRLLLSHDAVAQNAVFGREDVLCIALQVLSLIQEINRVSRKCGLHVLYEEDIAWKSSIFLELSIGIGMFRLVRGYGLGLLADNKAPLDLTTKRLSDWLAAEGLSMKRFRAASVSPNEDLFTFVASYVHVVSSPSYPTSVNISLHRFWGAMFYETLKKLDARQSLKQFMKDYRMKDERIGLQKFIDSSVLMPGFECFIAEYPLRVFVLIAQVAAGAWVRNGNMISLDQLVSKSWHEYGLDLDIFLLQCSASFMPGSSFIRLVAQRFELQNVFNFSDSFKIPDKKHKSRRGGEEKERLTDSQIGFMCEFMFLLLGILIHDSTKTGDDSMDTLHRQVVHSLASGPGFKRTFSVVESHVSDGLLEEYDLGQVLNSVAIFHPPCGPATGEGIYELNPEFLHAKTCYYFSHWTSEQRQSAEENARKYNNIFKRKRNQGESSSPLSIDIPCENVKFSSLVPLTRNILWNSELHGYIFRILHARICNANKDILANDGIVLESLRIFHQALQLCEYSSIVEAYQEETGQDTPSRRSCDGAILWAWSTPELEEAHSPPNDLRFVLMSSINHRIDSIQNSISLPFSHPILNSTELIPIFKSSISGVDESSEEEIGDASGTASTWNWQETLPTTPDVKQQPLCRRLPHPLSSVAPHSLSENCVGVSMVLMLLQLSLDASLFTTLRALVEVILEKIRIGVAPLFPGISVIYEHFETYRTFSSPKANTSKKKKGLSSATKRSKRKERIIANFANKQANFLSQMEELELDSEEIHSETCACCRVHVPSKSLGSVCYMAKGSMGPMTSDSVLRNQKDQIATNKSRSQWRSTREESILLQGCNHVIHFECYRQYVKSLVPGDDFALEIDKLEYRCPSCRSIANTLLPIPDQACLNPDFLSAVTSFLGSLSGILGRDPSPGDWATIITENSRMYSALLNEQLPYSSTTILSSLLQYVRWHFEFYFKDNQFHLQKSNYSIIWGHADFIREYILCSLTNQLDSQQHCISSHVAQVLVARILNRCAGDNDCMEYEVDQTHQDLAKSWLTNQSHPIMKSVISTVGTPLDVTLDNIDSCLSLCCPEPHKNLFIPKLEQESGMDVVDSILRGYTLQPLLVFLKMNQTDTEMTELKRQCNIAIINEQVECFLNTFRLVVSSTTLTPIAKRLVGTYMAPTSVFKCTLPSLIRLPKLYTELYLKFCNESSNNSLFCDSCEHQFGSESSILCLLCGTMLCISQTCKHNVNLHTIMFNHANLCSKTVCSNMSPFLVMSFGVIYITIDEVRSIEYGPIYLDSHGEEDVGLRRGKPLFLSDARLAHLKTLIGGMGFVHDTVYLRRIARIRETDEHFQEWDQL